MINSLHLENFRCFRNLSLSFNEKTIFLTGSNGQGKTSILEAVFFLANLRSFRTPRTSEMIRTGCHAFHIAGSIQRSSYPEQYKVTQGDKRILSIDKKNITKSSEFAGAYHTVAFLPDDPLILTGASQLRRRFFDMFISMMNHEYFRALQKYSTALKSRNVLLRASDVQTENMDIWSDILSEYGSYIVSERERYSALLSDFMHEILLEIRPELSDFRIHMRSVKGVSDKNLYRKKLDSFFSRDQYAKFTCFGPHADDFEFIANGKLLRTYGSRGQCRIVSFAMKLAELDLINSDSAHSVVLVDDAAGDLDNRSREAFFQKISRSGQIFHASTEPELFNSGSSVQTIHISPSFSGEDHV